MLLFFREQRRLIARCRPHTLQFLMQNFSPDQNQAVEQIGFGGLLHMKLKTLNRQMLPWLVEHFNGDSCMFTISTGKEFVVTRNDICDVFCLPMNDIPVPELKKNAEDGSVDKGIIRAWKSDYGLSEKQALHLSKLESRMVNLVDGGEEFKRCFVLHAMCSFLTPTTNRTVSLKLLKAVEEVDEIKNFDWCSYVLKNLKKAVQKYKNDEKAQNVSGCLLALQIMYFHRLNFQGERESSIVPLIQHWTDAKIKRRINLEIKAGGFGQGPLDTLTFPVSQPVMKQIVVQQPRTMGYDHGASTSGRTGRILSFELPEGVMSDDEIKEISTDAVHESFLLVKRNMEVFMLVQTQGFETLSEMIASRRTVSLSSDNAVAVSQTQQLLSDPHYLKLLDGLIEECNKMKSVNEMFRGFYESEKRRTEDFHEDEPAQGHKEDEPAQEKEDMLEDEPAEGFNDDNEVVPTERAEEVDDEGGNGGNGGNVAGPSSAGPSSEVVRGRTCHEI